MKILITPVEACYVWDQVGTEFGTDINAILTHGQIDEPGRLTCLLAEVDAAILGLERIDASVLDSARNLKVISRFGVGYDNINLDALKTKSIRLANTPGCMAYAVARQTIAFLLAITFNLFDHDRRFKNGNWKRFPNSSCAEMTLGIIGMGAVGSEVVHLATVLGYKVAAVSRSKIHYGGIYVSESMKDLIQRSTVVSLHVPLLKETREIISGEVVGWLSGKSLINTARGGLVSESDILEGLKEGVLRYYATDVFSVEPVSGISKSLSQHERVICTPHVGAMDHVTARTMLRQSLSNAINCVVGRHDKVNAYVF